jgi:hypothetical protein
VAEPAARTKEKSFLVLFFKKEQLPSFPLRPLNPRFRRRPCRRFTDGYAQNARDPPGFFVCRGDHDNSTDIILSQLSNERKQGERSSSFLKKRTKKLFALRPRGAMETSVTIIKVFGSIFQK